MTEVAVGIGLSGPLLNAQTLGHEQRGVAAQARKVLAQYDNNTSKPCWWRSCDSTKPWMVDGCRDE